VTPAAPWRARWPTALLFAVPAALVVGAYAWLAIAHGTAWLWQVVVHENGRYTLGETVLYVRHVARELPVDIAMGLFCAAALAAAEPGRSARRRVPGMAALLVVVVAGLVVAGAAAQEGWGEALRDLFQYRTRDDTAAYGSHWSFHLLSTIWFGAAAPLAAGIAAGLGGTGGWPDRRRWLLPAAWGWVALLSLIFGVQAAAFTDARFIGHQAREILTHGTITLPLALAVVRCATTTREAATAARRAPTAAQVGAWLAAAGIPVFLVLAFHGRSLQGTAQLNTGMSGLVAAHVFEHALDYIITAAAALAAFGAGRGATGESTQ